MSVGIAIKVYIMGNLFVYILKTSVCLSTFYLFYKLLLSKETFHRFNRIALLGVLLLSFLVPIIEITTGGQTEMQQTVLTIEQWLLMTGDGSEAFSESVVNQQEEFSGLHMILIVYCLGILFFVGYRFYSLSQLLILIRSGKRQSFFKDKIVTCSKDGTVVIHERAVAPFSWMNCVVISRKDFEENGREILMHEMAHIRHHHSWDLLITDICIIFQWFNPGAWLLKQELQNIHEYEADESVLKEGVNAKEYQLLLIKKAVGTRLYSMANSFNHSKLKKRITMMLKEKSNPWLRLKYLYILPLATIAVAAFARPEISATAEEISVVKVNDLASIGEAKVGKNVNAIIPLEVGRISLPQKHLVSVDDTTIVSPKKTDDKVTIGLSTNSLKVEDEIIVTGYTKGKVAKIKWSNNKNKNVKKVGNVNIYGFSEGEEPLFIIDGKEVSQDVFSTITPDRIESISILKSEAAANIYGEKGKKGVVVMTLLSNEKYEEQKKNAIAKTKGLEVYEEKKVEDISNNSVQIISHNSGSEWITVNGTVKDAKGKALRGASVIVKGTPTGTITDDEGHFSLKAPKGGMLKIVYMGMASVEVKATSGLKVVLEEEPKK